MIEIDDSTTIGEAFAAAATRYAQREFLIVPANAKRSYAPHGQEISYGQAHKEVQRLQALYRDAGYGMGHRIGLLLENRLEHLLHKLAMNSLGACCVPINPDYRTRELVYLLEHSKVDLVVALAARKEQMLEALAEADHRPPVVVLEELEASCADITLPAAERPVRPGLPEGDTPASILYTSGTTGQPKGCVLSHTYELAAGKWYASLGGLASIRPAQERLYNPLPLFHVNASVLSFYCMLLTGGAQIQTDRFQPSRFWQEVQQSQATIIHYLGVVVPMLLAQPSSELERSHQVRFGFGAGVEPQLHHVFEERYGLPLLEIWGMTEMVRVLCDCHEPRQVGTRAFGRSLPGLDAEVMDELGNFVPGDTPGELVIRHSAATPRKHFFSEYLDNPHATEEAWRGGWFHTGDVVYRGPDGMLHFMDRRKNIIRRSGENIACAEVEALLMTHPLVQSTAVLAVPDEVREEEVLACVVLNEQNRLSAEKADRLAKELFDYCHTHLAYYKAPGWIWFAHEIPTTGTQKIQKHRLFPNCSDPRALAGMHDLRPFKKRG
jgi:crotonobetaine/carnitine-CoA ligase